MESERLDTLKDNEEHIAKGGVESDSEDDEEGDGDEMGGEDAVSEDSDKEWKET